MRERQSLLHNLLQRKSCTGVTFTHQSMTFQSLLPQHLGTQHPVPYIGFGAIACYSRSINLDNTYIMQHGSLFDKTLIGMQLGVIAHNLQSLIRHCPAMPEQDVAQRMIIIIFVNDLQLFRHNL